MKLLSMKWLQVSLAVIAVLALIIAGCGGGGGGGSSEPIKVRTLSGTVYAPVAPPASLQPSIGSGSQLLSGSLLAAGGSPVANAKVWLEGYRDVPAQYTDASGTYKFIGVTADEHFVVSSFEYLGKTYKQRVRALVQSSDVDVIVPLLSLEEATKTLTGVLKDSAGNVLPAGTEMMLWGEVFTIGSNGSFSTPALPTSISQAQLFVKLPGATAFTGFYGPFTGGSTPAFIEQTVLPPDSGNRAPSGVLLARNTAGIETVKCATGEQLNLSLTSYDADTGHLERLKYVWTASRGTLQVTGNQTTATWLAMDSYGLATITVAITDLEGVTARVSLRILVNIQSPDETDTTPPTVVSRTPAANTVGVTPDSSISVVFSEELLGTSVTAGAINVTSQDSAVSGASALQADKKTIVWAPATVLPGNKTITVSLLPSISDLFGNQLGEQSSWSFSTTLVPGITVNSLYTNDNTPEITGTVDDPEATVSVTVNSRSYNAILDGTVWRVQVTDTLPDGVYNVSAVATNKSGVSGSDSSSNELTIDTRAETAVLSTLPPVITGSGQISITVGGTGVVRYIYRLRLLGDPWGDWSAEIPVSEKISRTALADGMHNLQVRAVDAAGNIQAEADATYYEWTVDKTAKIAQLATATLPLDPTNQTSINVTVVGSGVQLYRFNLNEGSWSGSFPVTTPISLIGLKSGTNVLRVIGGDSDGNWQPVDAPTTYTWVIDANVKVAVLLEKPLNPTNLDSASIKVGGTGVTKYKYSTNGGATWTAEILISATDTITLNGLADGSYSIRVIGGDDLGTWQATTNASIWNWVVDTKRPTVALTCDARANKSPVAVRIEFSEPVTGFSAAKLTVGNGGTVSSLQPITLDQVWIANITPAATGTVTVTVATEAVDLTDAAGNKNDGATVEFEFDSVNPTIILSTGEKEPTNNQAFTMTISFNKKISGFELNDLQVANGSASGLQVSPGDDTVWTATITAAGPGEVKAEIAANRLFDLFGNGNEPSNPLIRNYDPASPTVVISTGVVSPTKTKPVPITIKFSEKVKNFVDGDLTLTNCSVSNFVTSDNITWTADLDPGEGEAKIELDAAVAEDDAGNGNQAAVPLTVKYDSIPPTVSMTSLSDGQTVNDSPVLVTITFSEPVVGFNLGLLSPSNATAGNLQVVETDRIWTFEVTPKLKGLVTIDFAAGIIQDQAGHNNEASNQISFTYDSDRPTVTLTLGEGVSNPTSQALIPVTIEFSKPVVGFALDKLSTDNCTVQDLAVVEADENWTFNLKPTALGQVSVILEANKVTDAAGNGNTAAVRLRVYYDNVPPAVTLSSTASPTTNVSPIPLRITFTEVVQGFTKDALTVTNGAVSGDLRVITANKIWDADIVPNVGKGEVTVELPANIVKDTAGNDNTAAVALSRNYDSVAPELIVFDAVGVPDPTNLVAVTATIEFDEDVNGFDLSCLTVSNCSLSDLVTKTAKRKWEFKVTPGADDTVTGMLPVTVDLIANKVFDAAGNGNSASGFSRTFDRTRPLVYLSKKDGFSEPTNSKPFVIRIDFNEAINDLTTTAFEVSNGSVNSVTRVSENYRRWEAEINPTSDGTTGIRLKDGAAFDAAGNTNLESEILNIIYDGTRPGVSLISRATANNQYPIPITIEFTEPVSGLNINHLVVTGGGAKNLTGPDGNKWYADIEPSVQGAIYIDMPENCVVDAASNSNTAAVQLTVNYSSVRPTVVISSSESNPTNTNSIPVTIEFSDSVIGFEVGDLQITNASPANFNHVDGKTYTLTLTPQSNGLITVDVPAGVAENSGNTNTAATQFRITFDSIQPTAVLTTNSQSPTSSSSIPATITFSEKIKSFALTDLTRGNCDLDSLVEVVASRTWSFNIKPTPAAPPASVAVSLKLDAGKVEDLAGNTNPVSNEIKLVYDDSKPEPVLASTAPEPTNIKHIPVTLTFDRAVSGFALTDLVIVNGLAGNLQELVIGKQWSFTVNAGLEGAVTVDLPANRVLDAAGNGNATATQLLRTYNATRPGVVLTSSVTGPTNADTIPLTITFDKDISYFDLAYLVVDGGDKGNLLASSPVNRVWTASITPTITNGNITISLPANVATDSANNFNTAAVPLTIAYDKQSPTVTLTATPTAAIGQTPFDVTITFSEEVSGFLIDHIAVVNGTKGAALTTKTANRIWTLRVTPDSTGDVTIDIPANSAIKDLVGNELAQPATQLVVVCDMSPLTATIATSTEVLSPTKVTPIPLVVTFNKSIQNLFLSNLSVTNATVSGLSQVPGEDGKKWSFNLTPSINTGTASVILPANRVKDLAGNFNETSNLFEIYYDRVQPAAVLSSTASATTNLDPIPVTITFNEPVRDFVIGDLVVGNGSAGNLQPDPAPGLNNVWTVDITPTADGTVTVDLPKDKAEDAAGNLNTAAAQLVRTSDRISPTVTLTTTAPLDPDSTNINPIPVTIDFSEPVVGFDISKLTLSNATAGNWQPLLPSGQRWSVNISPAGSNVVVTVDVNANVASDSANNGNDAANQLKINYNSVRPTVTLSSAAPDPTNTSPIPFQIDFGKPVTSFSLTDLTIGNGIAGNLATLTASLSYSFDVAPGSDGNVTVDMAADKVKDDAGNWNDARFRSVASTIPPDQRSLQ